MLLLTCNCHHWAVLASRAAEVNSMSSFFNVEGVTKVDVGADEARKEDLANNTDIIIH